MSDLLTMLRELTEAPGVPGQEAAVRDVMRYYLQPHSEVITDNLGSIAGHKVGKRVAQKLCWQAIWMRLVLW